MPHSGLLFGPHRSSDWHSNQRRKWETRRVLSGIEWLILLALVVVAASAVLFLVVRSAARAGVRAAHRDEQGAARQEN